MRFCPADRFEFAVLQHAEQLDLQPGRSGRDFVEEDRAAVGLQKLAHFVVRGPGKRARHVAEELALQQRIGQRPQETSTNGLSRRPLSWWMARAVTVLPVPLSPRIRIVVRVSATLSTRSNSPHHLVIAADDVLQPNLIVELRPQLPVLFDDLPLAQGPLDRQVEFGVDHRLGDVVEGAHADRFDGAFDRAVAGDQDDVGVRGVLDGPLQQMKAVRIGQAHVAQDDLERKFAHPLDGVEAGEGGLGPVSEAAQIVGHGLADLLVVVDNQQRTLIGLLHRNHAPEYVLSPRRSPNVTGNRRDRSRRGRFFRLCGRGHGFEGITPSACV